MIGLYVHMPFCKAKCPYCDFYSIPTGFGVYDNRDVNKTVYPYVETVIRNIESYNERFDTVYFGGGTPSLYCWGISAILSRVRFAEDAEITVEVNPSDITAQDLVKLRDSGVNRLSIGIQSFANNELVLLGRRHNAEDANNAVHLAAERGFKNISADLMIGLPHQTVESVKRTIKVISLLPITHVSSYLLKAEAGTPFAESGIKLPSDEKSAALYLTAVKVLEEAGFKQYEISNFAKPGFECAHNLKYWKSEEYLGIGASAHSFYDGERFAVPKDITAFIHAETQPVLITDSNPCTFEDYAMLKLRLTEGLSFAECERFSMDKKTLLERTKLVPPDYINITGDGISLTKIGFLLSNKIIGTLIYGGK